MRPMTIAAVTVLALASLALAACGSDEEEAVSGQFALVAEAPDGYENVAGEATVDRSEEGTDTSVELTGLKPNTEYVAHVHASGCDQPDPGGPHYKFDPNGSDTPPNEIHLAFTSNADGEGEAEASNEQRIPDGEAGSIVVHTAEEDSGAGDEAMEHDGDEHSHAEKIACAELEGGTASEGAASEASEEDAMKHAGEKSGGGSSGTTIVVKNGEPVGGVEELEYNAGEQVRFSVRSDVADEVHVHGYDLTKDVAAGGTVVFSFPAEIEGIFEVELEERAEPIAELRVNP